MSDQHEHQSKHDPYTKREPGCSFCAAWQHPALERENAKVTHLERQLAERDAEIARLRREGVPGVMHEVDKSFYQLVISERDFARTQVVNRDAELAQLRRLLASMEDQEA